ncbi:OLC1v1016489C1 [Oldenlandia corymbosa var. corymbosa]|uniref:OLC1v1016489C1 n=1 Tax=Oldenlandia corymbosa var. corymbosa TaxID=529605 RepID=A0AAV1E6D1_OLDCO|nr:OLC1v1016489C1 [Oldenlandia corymbosa var. corymbosa]
MIVDEINPEIIGALAGIQIGSISDSDFFKPAFDFVTNLYMLPCSSTSPFYQKHTLPFPVSQRSPSPKFPRFKNPDKHVESIRVMNLFDKIRELIAALHCPIKFTLKDLIKPEPDCYRDFR